jgi:hypothetical protein
MLPFGRRGMQIVESTIFGLRTVRISLRSPKSLLRISLFPMVHVGEPAFFAKVYQDAFAHEVVLVEGVKSPIATRITRSYRWFIGSRRIDLALQPRYPTASEATVVLADLSHAEFLKAWRGVPLWLRLAVYVAAPLMGLHRRWTATRESLAKGLGMDDVLSQQELLDLSPEGGALQGAILDARDDCLIGHLREQIASAEAERSLAVVYGAGHMRAVIRELTGRHGYNVTGSEWLTVFTL